MKNPNALKTIGEVAKILSVPVHVIRFWEKKFSSVTPIKKMVEIDITIKSKYVH